MGKNILQSGLMGLTEKTDAQGGLPFLVGMNNPESKSNLFGPKYTKATKLKFNRVSNFDSIRRNANDQINGLATIKSNQKSQRLGDLNARTNASSALKNNCLASKNDATAITYEKTHRTFFSRLGRRLTIRRTIPKPKSASGSSCHFEITDGVNKRSLKIPFGRTIRRWLSKHIVPPAKTSPAALDGSTDKCVLHSTDSFPTPRCCLPSPNFPESNMCNSQARGLSLADESFESAKSSSQNDDRPCGTESLNCNSVVVLTAAKLENPTKSSTLSSPSVTALGPPPCYLNVSLAAFGYTCSPNWVSSQTLKPGNTPAATKQESASAFLKCSSTPQCYKSASPASPSHKFVQRQCLCLDLQDGDKPETLPTSQASPTTVNEQTSNLSRVTLRVKGNSNGVEGDQLQDPDRSTHKQQENWSRSSLIMLAVAQASPRSRNASSSTVASAATGSAGRHPLSLTDSSGGPFESLSITFPILGCHVIPKEERNSSSHVLRPQMGASDTSLSDEVIPSKTDLEKATPTIKYVNGHATEQSEMVEQIEQTKDGNHFLRAAETIELELRSRVTEIEYYLDENDFSDEVSGHLRTTVGKVNLLLSKKFAQFRGLCMESIEAVQAPGSAGDFVTLPSDLEGFWDMMMLQVDDVRSMVAAYDRLKQNGWQIVQDASNHDGQNNCFSTLSTVNRHQPKLSTVTPRQSKEAADIARSQARERLKATKLLYRRACRKQCNTNTDINELNGQNSTFLAL